MPETSLDVRDILRPAAGGLDHLRGCWTVGRVADRERAGNGVGALRLDDVVSSLADGLRDRRAARGLGSEELDRLSFDQAEGDEFGEGLFDLADERAAGHGADDVIGQAPAELFGDLVALGLRALCVVGTQVDVDEAPAVLIGDLGAEPVDVVVVAVDRGPGARRRPGY